MKYRKFPKTDLKVSVIGMGTHQFCSEWGKDLTSSEAAALLDKARELGINFLDTAECYGDHASEKLIGQAIRAERRDWIIATKFGHQFLAPFKRENHFSAQQVMHQLEDSLRALKTDYIDIYQFHSGSHEEFDQGSLWDALSNAVRAGKIRYLGLSIANDLMKKDDLLQVEKADQFGINIVQVVYNRLNQEPEERLFPLCLEKQIGVIARIPLARGLLSGKYKAGFTFGADDIRSGDQEKTTQDYLKMVQEIKEKEVPSQVPMAQWALAWCLKHPALVSAIPGAKNQQQLEINARAADRVSDGHPYEQEV